MHLMFLCWSVGSDKLWVLLAHISWCKSEASSAEMAAVLCASVCVCSVVAVSWYELGYHWMKLSMKGKKKITNVTNTHS